MSTEDKGTAEQVRNWWSTEIIDMRPGKIRIRGENIEDLIGNISFVQESHGRHGNPSDQESNL